jgi:hypothetical protein
VSNFLSDNFSSVASAADLTTSTGAAWTKNTAGGFGGSLVGSGNATGVYQSTTASPLYFDGTHTPPTADYSVTATLKVQTVAGSNRMVIARAAGTAITSPTSLNVLNGYALRYRPFHGVELCRIDSGTITLIGAGSGVVNGTDPANGSTITLTLTVNGTTITGAVSGAISGILSVTDTTYSAAGVVAMWDTDSAAAADTTGVHFTSVSGDTIAGGGSVGDVARRPLRQSRNQTLLRM